MPDLATTFRELRPYAFAIAYRMLGSVSEAEDVVQDAFLRLASANADEIRSPKAFLATVTTRLAIDELRSARVRRESYVGPWLPEPVLDERPPTPDAAAEMADSLTTAFLVVLETLSPLERAVFLLHDVFGYDYAEVAAVVQRSEPSCRQLASRARRRLADGRPRFAVSREEHSQLAERFLAACRGLDETALTDLFAPDAEFVGDGGGKGAAVRAPIVGREAVVRLLLGLLRRGRQLDVRMVPAVVNGRVGARFLDRDGGLISVLGIEVADGVIQCVRTVVNPDKLRHLGPVSPLARTPTD